MSFTLRQLRVFVTLADLQHFGATAEVMQLSQPTVSADIAQLERSIGVRLFERSRAGTHLTRAGSGLIPHAREVLVHADLFASEARAWASSHLEVNMAATPSLINHLVPLILQEVTTANPKIRVNPIEVDTGGIVNALKDGAHIGLGHHIQPGSGMRRGLVGHDALHVLASPDIIQTLEDDWSLKALSHLDLMLWPRKNSPQYYDAIVHACRERGWAGQVWESPSRISGPNSFRLTSGQAFAVVPEDYANAAPPTLGSIPMTPRATVPLHAIWNEPVPAQVRDLLTVLLKLRQTAASTQD